MTDEVVRLATELVKVEGHEEHPRLEAGVASHVAQWLRHAKVPAELQAVGPDQFNVIASVRGRRPGPTLVFNAHLDTVPPYGMADALRPQVRDGRLYGRGAVDMKGAMAAMLLATRNLSTRTDEFSGELVFAAVAGEESGSAGMCELARTMAPADFAIVGEPTNMRVASAHKGSAWIEVAFTGVAAHGSTPEQGVNAIYHAARFVHLVEEQLAPRLRETVHPLVGPATANVGVVAGGDRPPMVPARCVVHLDRRWLPGETHAGVIGQIRQLVERMADDDATVKATVSELPGTASFPHTPLECPADNPYLRQLLNVAASVNAAGEQIETEPEPIGVQFWTDGALLADRTGTPTVVCGPGDIAQAHSLDEWVSVEQLAAAAEIYLGFAQEMLTGRGVPSRWNGDGQ